MDYVRNHVLMYHSLIDIFKGGISYKRGDERVINHRYTMKARAIAVTTANVENTGEVEMGILSDPTLIPFGKWIKRQLENTSAIPTLATAVQ